MPFRVTEKYERDGRLSKHARSGVKVFRAAVCHPDKKKVYEFYNPLGLLWIPDTEYTGFLESLPVVETSCGISTGCGAITQAEAEQVTGLLAPVCWDRIMDDV